jgi:hypothetical protein
MSKPPDTDAGTGTDEGAMDYVEDIPIIHYKKPKIRFIMYTTISSSIQLTILHIPRDLFNELIRIQ